MAQLGELQLFASLVRALSHSVRGDLSVVVNDLAYFGTILPASEIERSKGRCATISRTLSKLSDLKDGCIVVKDHSSGVILALLHTVAKESVPPVSPAGNDLYSADLDRLVLCLKAMRSLVEQRVVNGANLTVIANAEPGALVISLSGDASRLLQERYFSATEYATAELGEAFVVEAVILDLLLRAQGMSVLFECESRLDSAAVRLHARLSVQQSTRATSEEIETV
jgi:hypothetical protein